MKSDGPKVSRRRSLLLAGGVAVGAGLGTILPAREARADDSKLTLKIWKRTEKGRVLVGTVDVPADVADNLDSARDDAPIRFRLENDDDKGTVHAESNVSEHAKVKAAIRRVKVRRKAPASKR